MEPLGVHPSRCNPSRQLSRWRCNWCQLESGFLLRPYPTGNTAWVLWVTTPPKIFSVELRG